MRAPPEQVIPARIAQAMAPAPSLPERQAAGGAGREPAFTFSPGEVLRHKDFETMTVDELARGEKDARAIRLPLPALPTRRTMAAARGHRVDLRATLRRADGRRRHAGAIALAKARASDAAARRARRHFRRRQ